MSVIDFNDLGDQRPIRRFKEPPPVNYGDVPEVLRWLVSAILHLDMCFDSRLSAIESSAHDRGIRSSVLAGQVKLVGLGLTMGGSVVYLAHAFHLI